MSSVKFSDVINSSLESFVNARTWMYTLKRKTSMKNS